MLEAILKFSISNRWMIVALTAMAAMLGIHSLGRLPIDAVPDITNNQVQINAVAPSFSPVEVEKQVTFPIETSLSGVPGLQSTRSLSRNGFSQVTAVFEDSVDIYFARQQVAERLAEARDTLPRGIDPIMGPIATGLGEVYMWTVSYAHPHGKGAPITDGKPGWQSDGAYVTPEGRRLTSELEQAAYLREVEDWIIRPQLRSVKDVVEVDAIGGYVKEYQVQPDPMKLVAYGLSFADVIDAIEKNNVSVGAGYVEHKGESYLVRASGRLESVDDIESIVIARKNGVPVHVQDVIVAGGVGVGRELRTGSASENGEEVVVGTALMLIGANSRTVASAVDARMKEVVRSLPPGIQAKAVLNRTKLVDATIHTVAWNLIEGAILVIVVLFLLLGNVRAALICASAIPLSILLTATGMVHYRVSGNLMSLGAIDFGLIVDGAVIIVENCLRRLAERQHREGRLLTLTERLQEVTAATREILHPSVFGQAIILTVYVPILALTGIEGKMFHPMAMTVIFALIGAFILSITFVPAMVAILIRGRVREKEVFLIRWAKALYGPVLRWALRLRWVVAAAALAAFVGAILLFTQLGQEFVPALDEKDIAMDAARIPSTSLSQSQAMQREVERAVAAIPEVLTVFSKTGTAEMATDPMPPNLSDTFIMLKPQKEWRSDAELDQIIAAEEESMKKMGLHTGEESGDPPSTSKERLQRVIGLAAWKVPGNNYEFTQPIQMRFNELISGVRADVAVNVYGDDYDQLQKTAQAILTVLSAVPGAADAKVLQTEGLPVMTVEIDRPAVARHGLSVREVQQVVQAAMGGADAGMIFEGDRRFAISVRLPDSLRERVETMEQLPIPLAPGAGFVPLGEVAKIDVAEGLNEVQRENGKRKVVVQCNVRGRDLGSFIEDAQAKVGAVQVPAGQWLVWSGQYEHLVAAKERLSVVVPICFLLIFILLFSTFRSVRDALLVFSAVPLGLTGGIVSLWLRGMPFSISAAVGFIALSGVAVLNGLVMLSCIKQLRHDGLDRDAAIMRGCLLRLRPVLMTALVASLGFLPMALATGTGAEVQKPLATVVIGGLVSSTFLTLLALPSLYRIFSPRGSIEPDTTLRSHT